jgi:phage host-nuclease inhibitor protein Gam
MSKTRAKLTGPVIKSRVEMETTVNEIAAIMNNERMMRAEMDAAILKIKERYEENIALCQSTLGPLLESARAWAEANPSEFGGKKSVDMVSGIVGWRTGNPQLKTRPGWTWDRVLEAAKALGVYVRTKMEVDKAAILTDREQLGDLGLLGLGVRVIQEEAFFVEPKLSEVDERALNSRN